MQVPRKDEVPQGAARFFVASEDASRLADETLAVLARAVGVEWYKTYGTDVDLAALNLCPASPCWSRPWRLDRTRRRGGASRPRSRKPSGAHLDCEPRDLVHGREWIPRRRIALVPRDARRHELAVTPPEHEEEWRERGGQSTARGDAASSLAMGDGRPRSHAVAHVAPHGAELVSS